MVSHLRIALLSRIRKGLMGAVLSVSRLGAIAVP